MGTNCALLVANLFLFCYERDFMMTLSDDKQADIVMLLHVALQLLSKIFIDSDFCHNCLHTLYLFECL